MNDPEWSSGSLAQAPVAASSYASLPSLDLRPLSTGELLDRVFFLYRARMLKFLALALVPASLGLLVGVAQLFPPARVKLGPGAGDATQAISQGLIVFLLYPLILVGYAMVQAATTRLVSQIYLSGMAQPGVALREAWPRTLRYVGIELWKVWSGIWVSLLLFGVVGACIAARHLGFAGFFGLLGAGGLVYGAIAYLRNSLAIPASVIENLNVRAAMRRSKMLVSGRAWRIFLIYLLLGLLYMVAGAVQAPFFLLVAHAKAPVQHVVATALTLALSFAISLLLSPIASIALCLFYFDERVRQEAFDIDFLLRGPEAALHVQASFVQGEAGVGSLGVGSPGGSSFETGSSAASSPVGPSSTARNV